MATPCDQQEIFSNLSSKIGQLLFGRTQGDRTVINQTLNELNSLNYGYPLVLSHTKAVLLINQCCSFIPTDDGVLIQKCSQLLSNLVNKQNVAVEGRTLTVSVQWCLQSLKHKDNSVVTDVLLSLDALLRNNAKHEHNLIDNVAKAVDQLISQYKEQCEIVLLALKCLEACTIIPDITKIQICEDFKLHLQICSKLFTFYLNNKPSNCDQLIYCKILIICQNGLQNIIIQYPNYLHTELGFVLGIIRTYMLYGIKGIDHIPPQKLLPSTLSIPEVPSTHLREKKGGKLTKQRKHRSYVSNKKDKRVSEDWVPENRNRGYIPATMTLDYNSDSGVNNTTAAYRLKTSDSDFSDTESGKVAKINVTQGRVRQASLNLFHNVLKHTDKSIIFSYWLSFLPEVTFKGKHNLISCILKDPSSKGRMAALNILLHLLTSSKLYLTQAETSDRSTSFTPFSVTLGLTLIELHKSLSLALNEISIPVLTQILKCFAALVQATPYHRLSSGIITKVVRNIKPFISHKDATVQVTALIVLGCVLASEPVVPETSLAITKSQLDESRKDKSQLNAKPDHNDVSEEDFDFAEFSSDEEVSFEKTENGQMSWLLNKCLMNLGLNLDNVPNGTTTVVPAPVKLESLQVLSAMSRNYFEILIAPHLHLVVKVLEMSLVDRYVDVQLHAGRTVDFIGQAINRSLNNDDALQIEQCLLFWSILLNSSLINVLQNEQHAILRAVGCDCIGSIGPQIFEQLPRDKQILCITLLFTCTRDEENNVRGAAVRALAICVLYPSLREDTGFVVDTAEAIHRTLKDENLTVRVKASWSLGNLSEALVLNHSKIQSDEDLPPDLLLKLLESSVQGAEDNDKIKMNAVRALGNLLQLIDEELDNDSMYKNVVDGAFAALVKGSTTGSNMKVRWNACYALGKALINSSLYNSQSTASKWQNSVFNALMDLVVSFRNFKVRINAALALMSPPLRENYGQFYHPVWLSLLKALENSQNMEDFSEYKHRDHLVEQICLAMGHLTSILQQDDLPQLSEIVSLYYDNFKSNMHKVLERLVPEKSSSLYSAISRLSILESQTNVNNGVIESLKIIFVHNI